MRKKQSRSIKSPKTIESKPYLSTSWQNYKKKIARNKQKLKYAGKETYPLGPYMAGYEKIWSLRKLLRFSEKRKD